VGPNGAGKTTLIEALAGRRELDGGRVRTGHNVQLGYLSQHAEELGSSGTVLEAAQRATRLTPNKARSLLGRFLFSGEEAEKPMDGLSGGERRRLSLAILVSSGANVLILDEPTNHLDIDAREALEDALSEYPGSLLLVSHDRALLDAVGTRTIAVEDGTLRSYVGGWPEYVRVREERKELAQAPKVKSNGAPRPKPKAKVAKSKNEVARAQRLEREIETAEAELKALESELGDPSAWASPSATERNTARHDAAKRRVEELMARWESVAG
jgi:ATP-binding cassette subfamily F protein 3